MFHGKRLEQLENQIQELSTLLSQANDTISNLTLQVQTQYELIEDLNEQLNEMTGHIKLSIEQMGERLISTETQLTEMAKRDQNSKTPDMMKYSSEPWMQFVGGEVDPVRGVAINIDWNTAFVDQLRKNGFTGINEMQVVSQFIAQVAAKHQMEV